MESRVEDAVKRFEEGYNCCQAIFATYADLFGIDNQTALKLSSPMGGGVARMREICGAVSGMVMIEGLMNGNTDPADKQAQGRTYETARVMCDRFKEENGSILCRDLIGQKREQSAVPSERTPEYYAKRPCSAIVASAARILEQELEIIKES